MSSEESTPEDRRTERCALPGCGRPQEFPKAEEARCIEHSLEWYFFWTPLAEFGPVDEVTA